MKHRPARFGIISIHALREEGDCGFSWLTLQLLNFYPRPPRGGRLLRLRGHSCGFSISIHALREEGDPREGLFQLQPEKFLSTPSARRATRAWRG